MRRISWIFGLVLSLAAFSSFAGAGHDHEHGHSHDPVTQTQAETIASEHVARLVAANYTGQ